jgi:hypothetical protein
MPSLPGAQRISLADRRAYGPELSGGRVTAKAVDQGPLILLAYLLFVEDEVNIAGAAQTYLRIGASSDGTIREWRRELEDALLVAGLDGCLSADGDQLRLDRDALPPGRCDLADVLRAIDASSSLHGADGSGGGALASDEAAANLLKLVDPRTRQGRARDLRNYNRRYTEESHAWRERLYTELAWHLRQDDAEPELARLRRRHRHEIELELSAGFGMLVEVPVSLSLRTAQVGMPESITFDKLLGGDERRALVTAPSGNGKTTAALKAALTFMAADPRALAVMTHADVSDFTHVAEQLVDLDGPRLVFVHDRIDSRRGDAQVLALCRFVERFPASRHVVLARDTWDLHRLPMFAEYELVLADRGDEVISGELARHGLSDLHPDVVDLCRTPLYLNMLLAMADGVGVVGLPRSRYALYEKFIDSSLARHGRERGASRSASASVRPYLAVAERLRDEGELSVREACETFENAGIDAAQQDGYLTSPILRIGPSREIGAIGGEFVSWAHASFGSFFLAEHALRRWQAGELTARELNVRLGGPENGIEALRFAIERSADPEALLDALIIEGALIDVLEVAAGAVRRAPKACCDLIVRALDAFKWCDPPCYYPLVRAARRLYRDLSSEDRTLLPHRIAEDLNYLITDEGDAMTFAPRTGDVRPISELTVIAEDDQQPLEVRMDAVAALGGRLEQDVSVTLMRLTDPAFPRDLRIAALLALTTHGPSVDLAPIRRYIRDENEDTTVRSRALDLCGAQVDQSVAESLLSLLEGFAQEADGRASAGDPGDDLSDSAAWSLCRIGVRDRDVLESVDGYNRLAMLLSSALPHWPLATVVYALATSREPAAAQIVIGQVGDRPEGYLLEDVCHAIGRIGDPAAERYLVELVGRTDDSIVHRHAVLAARAIGRMDVVLEQMPEELPPWVARARTEPLPVSGHLAETRVHSASGAGEPPS